MQYGYSMFVLMFAVFFLSVCATGQNTTSWSGSQLHTDLTPPCSEFTSSHVPGSTLVVLEVKTMTQNGPVATPLQTIIYVRIFVIGNLFRIFIVQYLVHTGRTFCCLLLLLICFVF